MTLQSSPVSMGAPCSASMASSSSTPSSVVAHGRHSNLPVTIAHSMNAAILSSDLISCSEVPEQPSWNNYPGLPAQAAHYADPVGGLQSNNGIGSVQSQQIPGSVRTPNECDGGDEWLRYLRSGTLDDIIATVIPPDKNQMAGSAHASPSLNSETREHIVHHSVAVPSNSQPLYPTVSPEYPPASANVHSPRRTKVRMRWTMEMHDRFVAAVKHLGGSENAKPKAILDIMKVEGLTREQVKSHLQKYKSAQVKHHDTSAEMITSNEAVPSDVQISIEKLALQVQMEFQKKLLEVTERTRHDLLEIVTGILKEHVMRLQELEKRRGLSTDHTAPLSASSSRRGRGDGSSIGCRRACVGGWLRW